MSDYSDLLRALADLIDEHDLPEAYTDVSPGEVEIHRAHMRPLRDVDLWLNALGPGGWEGKIFAMFYTLKKRVETLPGSPEVTLFYGTGEPSITVDETVLAKADSWEVAR